MTIASANITISVAVLVLAILGVLFYLLAGMLVASKVAINSFSFGLCLLAWPVVGLVFAGAGVSLVVINTHQLLIGDKCLCPPERRNPVPTYDREGDGVLRCTRCGHRAKTATSPSWRR